MSHQRHSGIYGAAAGALPWIAPGGGLRDAYNGTTACHAVRARTSDDDVCGQIAPRRANADGGGPLPELRAVFASKTCRLCEAQASTVS
jgi:hypothetical protein